MKEKAIKAVKAVREIVIDVDNPSSLKEIGVPRDKLEELAEEVIEKYQRPYNPRKLTKESALKIYEKMWKGELD